MLDGIDYTEEDAEFDSQLVFREIEDLDPSTWMGNALIGKHGTEQDNQIRKTLQAHLQNIRFSRFAREAVQAEYNNCQECEAIATTAENLSTETQPQDGTMKDLYAQRLSECNRISAVWIPNVDQMISDAGSVRVEASMKQLKKDIERDRLLVNGIRIVGAELGLDTVLQKICDVCDQIHTECGIPILGNEVKEFAVLSLLSKASRSHSGGIAFQAVQSLIDPTVAMLMPQSAVTPPLKINIHLGAFPSSSCRTTTNTNTNTTATTARRVCTEESCTSIADLPASPTDANFASFGSASAAQGNAGDGQPAPSTGKCKWGLVCKVTCESIFKIQLFDAPEEVGYDDCSTGELEQGDDEAPCLFRPVSVSECSENISGISRQPSPGTDTENGATESATGNDLPAATSTSHGERLDPVYPGITLGHRNTFVSVIYEDYVLFEVKLAPPGELSNFENLIDDWKETASVSITEIVPVRTLM